MERTVKFYLYEYDLPTPPPDNKVLFHNVKKREDQYWVRPEWPVNFNELTVGEQAKIVDRELERRIDGCYFFNNGEYVYLTGDHYNFLTYYNWAVDNGSNYSDFRISQRDVFYFLDMNDKDPNSFGDAINKNRRYGLSNMLNSRIANRATLVKDYRAGFQNKTGDEARDVNFAAVVNAVGKMPAVMQPMSNSSTDPKKKLEYKPPAIKITHSNIHKISAIKKKMGEGLGSSVTWKNTVARAYDSDKLNDIVLDEFAKWPTEADPIEALQVLRKTCSLGNEKVIIGKIHAITTCPEKDIPAFEKWKIVYKSSDPRVLDGNGRTGSGLKRLFISAVDAAEGFIDVYGYCDKVAAEQWIRNSRQKFLDNDDYAGYQAELRQAPITEDEPFRSYGSGSAFDNVRLQRQFEIIISDPKNEMCRLDWKNDKIDSELIVVPDKSRGRYEMVKEYLPLHENRNRIRRLPNGWKDYFPNTEYGTGVDPFNFSDTVYKGSRGAAVTIKKWKYISADKWQNVIPCIYCERPPSIQEFAEDMIKQCVYFGSPMLMERTNIFIPEYFEQRGYGNFCLARPKEAFKNRKSKTDTSPGIPAQGRITQLGCELIDVFTKKPQYEDQDNLSLIQFPRLLESLLNFDPLNTKKYDLSMAFIYALIAVGELKYLPKFGGGYQSHKIAVDKFFNV